MCGFPGAISSDGSLIEERTFADALTLMRHRGPDDSSTAIV